MAKPAKKQQAKVPWTKVIVGSLVGSLSFSITSQSLKYQRRVSASNEVLDTYREYIASADCYAGNTEYLDWLHQDAHDKAFLEAYRNGYRTPSRNSRAIEYDFADKLFTAMMDRARTDNAAHLADCLNRIKQEVTVKIHSSRRGDDDSDSSDKPTKPTARPKAPPTE